jgi:putative ABC transport system permease protein
MLGNYLKVAFRNILRHKGFSFINIAGLAIGMACSLVIFLYIIRETSFDRFNKNAGRIFRLTMELKQADRAGHTAYIQSLPPLEKEFPEVTASVRLFTYSWKEKTLVSDGVKYFYEERFFLADPSIFNIFSIPFLKGDPESALAEPNRIVISESTARKYFGQEAPLGKVLSVKNLTPAEFIVSGVFEDFPDNSHLHCDFIAPLAAGSSLFWDKFLERNSFYTYVLLDESASAAGLEKKFPSLLARHFGKNAGSYQLHLQPLTDIHLRSHLGDEIEANGDLSTIYLFSLLALIILASACINFINLATARSEGRAKEVGLRKVIGAQRAQLIHQFLSESFVFALAALPLALSLIGIFIPPFNAILNTDLSLSAVGRPILLAGLAGIILFVGLVSGSYPAFLLSGFPPTKVLKSRSWTGSRRSLSRTILVVVQCAVSVILIVGTFVVFFQMRYIQNKKLGFDKDDLVILSLKDWESLQGYPALKGALVQSPNILRVSASANLPSDVTRTQAAWHEGLAGEDEEPVYWNAVDYDFLETFGIELAAGRDFSKEFPSDEKQAYIVNESAAKAFGWDQPLGKMFSLSNRNLMRPMFEKGTVIGVVKDFHAQSLHKKIEPVVLSIQKGQYRYAAVKIRRGRTAETLDFMAAQWKKVYPERPFEYFFFDEEVAKMYQSEHQAGRIFGYATLLSILVAGLGLYGLASFSAAKRTKEIGIRKTLGASVSDIALLLSREFTLLFVLANAFALPAAYFLMNKWLHGFVYRIRLGPQFFISAAFVAFAVLLVSVGTQAAKAALANPADSLKYE